MLQALDSIEAATQPAGGSQIPMPPTSQPIFGWHWTAEELQEMQEALKAAANVTLPKEQNEKIARAAERFDQETVKRARRTPAAGGAAAAGAA